MSACRFDHAGGSVVFSRGPLYPESGADLYQALAQSAGADRFAADPVLVEKPLPLRWRGMPTTEADALESFLRNVVAGMAENFTYTDPSGDVHTVHFAEAVVERSEIALGREEVTIQLIEV